MKRTRIAALIALGVLALCPFATSQTQPSPDAQAAPAKELTLDLGNEVTLKVVLVPAGKFLMGSPEGEKDRNPDEGPQHEVTLSKPFYVGVCEVTQLQYQAVMGKNPAESKSHDVPVVSVSWNDAAEFCVKASAKTGKAVSLPTEAQWEYACRAGGKTRFCCGDDNGGEAMCEYAWCARNTGGVTRPGGQKKPNAWGLYDMHGNVWEWCSDWYAPYAGVAAVDPKGPDSGTHRVLRGGSWDSDPPECRSASRLWILPADRSVGYGFRIAVGVK
ncbi:MAG: formylglycine-generating enzyme family protein [Planctomycetota bacterium]|nr:formylglycine-generating enzyme family protein [Planctomycetota bacterium]